MICAEAQGLIDKILTGSLQTAEWATLRAHAATCDGCRRRYDRAVLAERMLEGGLDAINQPSALELDRIGLAVLDATAKKATLWSRLTALLPSTPVGFGAWAASTAVVLLLAVPLLKRPPSEFQARGGQKEPTMRGAVRVLCVSGDGNVRETHRCALDDQLKLVVSSHGYHWLFLAGIDEEKQLLWYAPRPPATTSVELTDGVDVPIGPTIRLGVNHRAGKVRVVALFSETPISSTDVEQAVQKIDRPLDPSQALPLGRSDLEQRSVMVEIAP